MDTKTLILMQGIPGSGKSYLATALEFIAEEDEISYICHSTDELWYDKEDNYHFKPEKVGEMHKLCFENTVKSMDKEIAMIIVDNCNTKIKHVKKYVQEARKRKYDIQVIRCMTPLSVCMRRNAQHSDDRKVPKNTIKNMFSDGFDDLLNALKGTGEPNPNKNPRANKSETYFNNNQPAENVSRNPYRT